MISAASAAIAPAKRVLCKDATIKFTRGNLYRLIGANGSGIKRRRRING